jgi:hypothetical protein
LISNKLSKATGRKKPFVADPLIQNMLVGQTSTVIFASLFSPFIPFSSLPALQQSNL